MATFKKSNILTLLLIKYIIFANGFNNNTANESKTWKIKSIFLLST